jgi:GT2 family glycosyltransferase
MITDVVVVIVTHDSADVLTGCLDSLRGGMEGIEQWDVLVVDNASSDSTIDIAADAAVAPRFIVSPTNSGYAAGVNRAVREWRSLSDPSAFASTAFVILNPDVRLHSGAVARLLRALEEPATGIVVPRLVDTTGRVLHSLRREPTVRRAMAEAALGGRRSARFDLGETIGDARVYDRPAIADWATGAAMVVSAACLDAIGEWDESFFLYSEETDFALRARDAGFATRFVPDAGATHIGGESHTVPELWSLLTVNKVRAFRRRHGFIHSAAFGLAILANEILRIPTRGRMHRAGAWALLRRPATRASSVPNPTRPAPWVCFSAQDWWCHNRGHSDFQLMTRVAHDRPVLLVNSIGMRMPLPGRTSMPLRRVLRKLRSTAKGLRQPVADVPGFSVLTPLTLPFYGRGRLSDLSAALVRRQVAAACRRLDIVSPVCMVTLPTAWPVVEPMPRQALVFNRSDKHSAFAEANGTTVAEHENDLLRAAELVVYTSHALLDEERPRTGRRAHFLDHGVDLELFRPAPHECEPPDLVTVPRPRIGFFGGLNAYQIDFDLLERLARDIPDAHLVLIGRSDTSLHRFDSYDNVWCLGPRPYETIPAYGNGFDVAIMPWLANEWIRYCNPIKLKEYLALGLPVVSTRFPEIDHYQPHVRVADDHDGFVAAVRRTLDDGGPGNPAARRAAVAEWSWDRIAQDLCELATHDSSQARSHALFPQPTPPALDGSGDRPLVGVGRTREDAP